MFHWGDLRFTILNVSNARSRTSRIDSFDGLVLNCAFLLLMGVDAMRIHHEPRAVLGPDPMPYLAVTCALRSAIRTQTDSETPHSEIDDAIVRAPGDVSFASVKELAPRLCCAPATAYHHLTESRHFIFKHLQWVPHDATLAQKFFRVEKSNELLRFIKSARHNDPALNVPLEEYWF
jgi:hypothetical protein